MRTRLWTYLFFAALLAELIAVATGVKEGRFVTKPLLMIILAAWFSTSSSTFLPLRYYIVAALFFSWLGDVFLLFTGPAWFMAGLGSFLLAHILYSLFFWKLRSRQPVKAPIDFLLIALTALYVFLLVGLLYPHTGALKIPVIIYACTIAAMLVMSIHAFGKNSAGSKSYCVAGAILFMLSDSLLAVNKFYDSFAGANLLIMLTYGLAQFAITKGSLLYLSGVKAGVEQ